MDDRIPSLRIEPMESHHIDGVAQLEKEVFSTPWSYESIDEELSNPLAAFFVATIEDQVVGYVGMNYIIDEGYITNIAVTEKYRRMGIAKKLLKALYAFAKENNLSFLSLEVRKSNQLAIDFYTAQGFSIEGERLRFYTNPTEDAYIMTKRF